jgi:hypothetical protein
MVSRFIAWSTLIGGVFMRNDRRLVEFECTIALAKDETGRFFVGKGAAR